MRVVSNIEHIVASHAGDRILIGCERQRGASRNHHKKYNQLCHVRRSDNAIRVVR